MKRGKTSEISGRSAKKSDISCAFQQISMQCSARGEFSKKKSSKFLASVPLIETIKNSNFQQIFVQLGSSSSLLRPHWEIVECHHRSSPSRSPIIVTPSSKPSSVTTLQPRRKRKRKKPHRHQRNHHHWTLIRAIDRARERERTHTNNNNSNNNTNNTTYSDESNKKERNRTRVLR